MQEIERFFGNLFSSILNRFKYSAMDATERKIKETVDRQVEQHRQRSQPKDREDQQ
ncbi:MAG: hypothetical protein RM338_20385 [Nostoc sp. DedQUE12a]|nr:hypothetical protein [Nostoc sp. DedQUE12a]